MARAALAAAADGGGCELARRAACEPAHVARLSHVVVDAAVAARQCARAATQPTGAERLTALVAALDRAVARAAVAVCGAAVVALLTVCDDAVATHVGSDRSQAAAADGGGHGRVAERADVEEGALVVVRHQPPVGKRVLAAELVSHLVRKRAPTVWADRRDAGVRAADDRATRGGAARRAVVADGGAVAVGDKDAVVVVGVAEGELLVDRAVCGGAHAGVRVRAEQPGRAAQPVHRREAHRARRREAVGQQVPHVLIAVLVLGRPLREPPKRDVDPRQVDIGAVAAHARRLRVVGAAARVGRRWRVVGARLREGSAVGRVDDHLPDDQLDADLLLEDRVGTRDPLGRREQCTGAAAVLGHEAKVEDQAHRYLVQRAAGAAREAAVRRRGRVDVGGVVEAATTPAATAFLE